MSQNIRDQVALWLYDMDYSTRLGWDEYSREHYLEQADIWLRQEIITAVRADAVREIAGKLERCPSPDRSPATHWIRWMRSVADGMAEGDPNPEGTQS